MNASQWKHHLVAAVAVVVCVFSALAENELPSGYVPLEWIASSGTQYIKTGYTHTPTTKVDCVITAYRQGSAKWAAVFGSRKDTYASNAFSFFAFSCAASARNLGLPCYNRTGDESVGPGFFPFDQRVHLVCDGLKAEWQGVDDPSITGSIVSSGTADGGANGMYIFDVNKANGSGDSADG